jgi:predicted nucleotidyltransferase component of viral defense system
MIPKSYITEWSKVVPWQEPRQIEQDLIITRAIIEIYSHPILKKTLAFRGGTALNKLIFNPPSRYSEDIDLVQVNSEPIGETIDSMRSVMDSWLGEPKRSFSQGLATLTYRIMSDESIPIKLKLEINTREHFTVLGFKGYPFSCVSSWCSGTVNILSYKIEELLGTKLRALYQRRKGRDLYDLYMAFKAMSNLDSQVILDCFQKYLAHKSISKHDFFVSMKEKLENKEFREDIVPLLPSYSQLFDPDIAYEYIYKHLIDRLS